MLGDSFGDLAIRHVLASLPMEESERRAISGSLAAGLGARLPSAMDAGVRPSERRVDRGVHGIGM